MKKINYVLTVLLFSIFTIQPANANLEIVMGPLGPQVVTNFAPPASFGPTVGGHNGGTVGSVGGSYAIVDPNGGVSNIIVCHSYCANGTFGPGGDTAALQIPNSNVGLWFGPETTTYDRETKTFTATNPNPQNFEITDGESSVIISGNEVLTFVSGNIFVNNENLVGVEKGWTLDSTANVSVTEDDVKESLNLENRKTNQEIRKLIEDSNLLLLNKRVEVLINLLGSWVK
jgi:hypothetical protein